MIINIKTDTSTDHCWVSNYLKKISQVYVMVWFVSELPEKITSNVVV